MNKYIYRASFGLLALGLGGCASLPFMGGGQSPSPTASASPTTTATNAASPTTSPTASASPGAKSPAPNDPKASPSPNAKKSPLPTPSTQASTAPGIILSTNPEERLLANNKVGGRANKVERNPFSNIPSIPLPGLSESGKNLGKKEDETPQLPKTENQNINVSVLTSPSPPPQWRPQAPIVIRPSLPSPNVTAPMNPMNPINTINPMNPINPINRSNPVSPINPSLPLPPINLPESSVVQVPSLPKLPVQLPGRLLPEVRLAPQEPQMVPVAVAEVPSLPNLSVDAKPQWQGPGFPPVAVGLAPPPPPPDTSIASNIEVSGVLQVDNNKKQIIVKVPTEATSRYVQEGQRLANGEVLVKRIELSDNSDPIVVFEQNGQEVTRSIGEKPAGDNQEKS